MSKLLCVFVLYIAVLLGCPHGMHSGSAADEIIQKQQRHFVLVKLQICVLYLCALYYVLFGFVLDQSSAELLGPRITSTSKAKVFT